MGERGIYNPDLLREKLKTFVSMGNEQGVNIFKIVGMPYPNSAGIRETIVGLFPKIKPKGVLMVSGQLAGPETTLYSRIIKLEVPQDALDIDAPDTKNVRDHMEKGTSELNLPSCALVFGRDIKSGEEIIVLYALVGIAPETALREIQIGVRQALAQMN